MKITFLGGTGTVTGSKYLVQSDRAQVLVDCGLFQGLKALRLRNWRDFPVEPSSLDAIVLTHAHIDHSGYVPVLVKRGFKGPVFCTPGTKGLCKILLPDSGHLQEEEARYANRKGFSRHKPALPLYTKEDAQDALHSFKKREFGTGFQVAPGISCRFEPAGHILGAASVRLTGGGRTIVFSGDLGRPDDPVLKPPRPLGTCDYVVVESTYGNRRHRALDPAGALEEVTLRTWNRGGTLLVPSFAVGRAQTLLHLIAQLKHDGRIPDHPVFLDSPMTIDATELYSALRKEHRLTDGQSTAMCQAARFLPSPDDSKSLNAMRGPMLIVSASGMATGGRILHHLKRLAPDSDNTILFVGFQAAGTRGESIVNGADEVKIHGKYVPVRAEVAQLDVLSAHADYTELIDWLRATPTPPHRVFVTHGEPAAADSMRRRIVDELGWRTEVPEHGQTIELD